MHDFFAVPDPSQKRGFRLRLVNNEGFPSKQKETMKTTYNKLAAIIIAFLGTVLTSNAEEMAPEQVQDTIYVSNPADIEYSAGMLSSKYNYQKFVEERSTRKWKVEGYVGNDVEPATFWSANREGLYIAAVGAMSNFDNTTSWGGGGEVGYLRKYWGFSVTATVSNGYPDRTSERQSQFTQLDVMGRLYLPGVEFKVSNNGSIMRMIPYVEGSWKKCSDYHTDGQTSVTTQETDEEYIITTTKTTGNLDAKPHVWGFAGGLRIEVDPWGSPLFIYGTVDYGRSQRFTYVRGQWHNQLKVSIGVGFRLFNNHGYNKNNLHRAGYTEREVKHYNW